MPTNYESLSYERQMELAVLNNGGGVDFELAQAAGMLATPGRCRLLPQPEGYEPTTRHVHGYSALSLNAAGEASFRTATFGLINSDRIQMVDNIGARRMATAGRINPILSDIVTSSTALQVMHSALQFRDTSVLGGNVTYAVDDKGTAQTSNFVTDKFDEQLDEMVGKRSSKVGLLLSRLVLSRKVIQSDSIEIDDPKVNEARKEMVFKAIAASARKRAAPVIIAREFTVTI